MQRKFKPIKIKLIFQPKSPEEVRFRLMKAFEVLLPKEEIMNYLNSSKKVGKKPKNYGQRNKKSKTKVNEIIT